MRRALGFIPPFLNCDTDSRAENKERVENQFLDREKSILCIFLCFDSGFEQLAPFPQNVMLCCNVLWQLFCRSLALSSTGNLGGKVEWEESYHMGAPQWH